MKEVLDTNDVSTRLGLSRRRVQQLAQAKTLPFVRLGSRLVIPIASWDRWMAQQGEAALAAVEGADHAR